MSRLAPTVLALLAVPALADVKIYKNDSLPDAGGSGTVACQAGFVANEIGAAVLTVPPDDGQVLLLDLSWWACDATGFGLAQARPMQVQVYPSGSPDPGVPMYISPNVTATPNFLNQWPVEDQDLRFNGADTFTVGVQLLSGSLFQNFTTLATDADGCQPGKNLIFAIPGGWTNACSFGVSGDMFVRARVLTNGPDEYGSGTPGSAGTPDIDSTGAWMIGSGSFAVTCSDAAPNAPGFLGYSTGFSDLPLFGGKVLIDPLAPGANFLPLAASPTGDASVPVPIPGGTPSLVGVRLYFQYGFVDAGAPAGVSLSEGLDVLISNNV